MNEMRKAYETLGEYRYRLTRQQVRTLAGQIKAGHPDAAMNGLAKILNRGEEHGKTNTSRTGRPPVGTGRG